MIKKMEIVYKIKGMRYTKRVEKAIEEINERGAKNWIIEEVCKKYDLKVDSIRIIGGYR